MSDGASQRHKELSLRRGTKGMGPYPKRYSRKPLARTGECEAFFVTPATVQEIFQVSTTSHLRLVEEKTNWTPRLPQTPKLRI